MARRSDHSRDELRELILASAMRLVRERGEQAFNARAIATEVGYSPGTIYNVFGSLDELSLQLAMQTMQKLLEGGRSELKSSDPREALRQMARYYFRFSREEGQLWNMVRTRRWTEQDHNLNDYRRLMVELLGVLEQAIAPLFEPYQSEARRSSALVLWASIDGINALSGTGSLMAMPERKFLQLTDRLIDYLVAGLEREREGRMVA